MSLFQNSVQQKYINQLDAKLIDAKYTEFKSYFGNPEIQENIRNSKEEQFQEGFLRELFVKILGYTLNPSSNFNLTTEYKNVKDSKKADGAILDKGACSLVRAGSLVSAAYSRVVGVIELKGTNTTDLSKIETQAFGYKNNQADCVYVITSNFEKLRFYIDNAIEFIEFNLFTLSKRNFELLYLCLSYENIAKGIPKTVKTESVSHEDIITKKLYKDYSQFKRELHHNLVAQNPQFDVLTIFKKSQKLLDRFLFLFFAEDRQLLPPNSVRLILNDWKDLKDREVEIPLYNRFKKYFEYLNTGFKGKRYDVFAYNGGLFKPDEVLDTVTIDDDLLYRNTLALSGYDFISEVDVNILGHIFENSLNELDEIKAQLEGQAVDKSQTRRKKDGVFYTPKYITKYIVENTIGKLCIDKKAELLIEEEEYTTTSVHAPLRHAPLHKKTKQALLDKLKTYQNWLIQLTICDPACGSGAFLNQALDFLITEHRYIDELKAKLFGVPIIFSDIEKSILENNLFGVDLNDESVEIAKLSLWLRTAQPNRKLNDLNNNIKCGNSLIDDPAIAGDKAFNWQKEFPQVFKIKLKKTWHITCATHNSRYSQRMYDHHVKLGVPVWLSAKEEIIVTETIADIAQKDDLNILAYNICGDHMHLILVCEDEELPKIVQKIKSMSARACNIAMGRTIPDSTATADETREHAPTREHALTREHAPSSVASDFEWVNDDGAEYQRGTTQAHLWTQKFGRNLITSGQQLENTIAYIKNNRIKHGLPPLEHASMHPCSIAHAYREEYKGGFDVVIGNPPYVQLQSMGEMSEILKNCGYETFDKGADLYCIFTERGYQLLKNGGMQSFIMPNKWMLVAYGKPLRKFLSKTGLRQVLNFGDIQFFQEATTYVCIFVTQKSELLDKVKVLSLNQKTYHGDFLTETESNIYEYSSSNFGDDEWSIKPYKDAQKLEQMKLNGIKLKDLPISINYGIKTGFNDAFFINEETRQKLIAIDNKSSELIKPMVRGRNISAYSNLGSEFLINVHNGVKGKNSLSSIIINDYPAVKKHLDAFYPMLEKRGDKGNTPYNLRNCAYLEEFSKPKIIYPNMTSVFPFMYDESGFFSNDKSFILTANDDSFSLLYLTSVFNSSLAKLWIWYNCPELQGGTREIRKVYFEHFPVPQANEEQTARLAQYATERTQLTSDLQTLSSKFQRTLQRKFALEELPGKLQNWYLLSYKELIAELGKKKVKLTLSEEAEWEDYFLQESKKATDIKIRIETTDKEIDQMVYALYGLTEEEIKIVEG
ncbi:MAG: Eco57I restriction-modification methylase domain-containing protein [Bacteroidota bacterium]|nr:Eco57I restriction-modification methylase domain-containing protein [Bacteroidota bacterium]